MRRHGIVPHHHLTYIYTHTHPSTHPHPYTHPDTQKTYTPSHPVRLPAKQTPHYWKVAQISFFLFFSRALTCTDRKTKDLCTLFQEHVCTIQWNHYTHTHTQSLNKNCTTTPGPCNLSPGDIKRMLLDFCSMKGFTKMVCSSKITEITALQR